MQTVFDIAESMFRDYRKILGVARNALTSPAYVSDTKLAFLKMHDKIREISHSAQLNAYADKILNQRATDLTYANGLALCPTLAYCLALGFDYIVTIQYRNRGAELALKRPLPLDAPKEFQLFDWGAFFFIGDSSEDFAAVPFFLSGVRLKPVRLCFAASNCKQVNDSDARVILTCD